ncbi:MAG: hypothetical protein LBL69_02030, partial [Zoogloeaceae bacterium]|nr:hypothetical protein [Zoogloeaceae bacterium]
MRGPLARVLWLAPLTLLWLLAAHWSLSAPHPGATGAFIAIAPMMLIAFFIARSCLPRRWPLVLWALTGCSLVAFWPLFKTRFEWVYLVQHVGAFSLLAAGFGRSLLPDSEALASRISRLARGGAPLDPLVARYTRRVTIAWTLFFTAVAILSVCLFFSGRTLIWSAFINFATPLLVGLMFAGEFLLR